jgi:lambda family phage minor tail protein L
MTAPLEARKLNADRLVKLYEIDATDLGGGIFRFVSTVDDTLSILSLTGSGSLATLITSTPHMLITGEELRVMQAAEESFNGLHVVTVVDPFTLTYPLTPTYSGSATGSYITALRAQQRVYFDGNEYVPVPITITGFEWNGQGVLPNPTLQISNINKIIMSAVLSYNNLTGATFTRTRTFRKHLDDGIDPDPSMVFPRDVFRINRKVAQNKVYMEFELATPHDQEGVKIPGRQMLRNACTHRYRVWDPDTLTFDYSKATCPYTSASYFKPDDSATVYPAEDKCGKHLSSCRARFGTAPLPTRAFPGIGGR